LGAWTHLDELGFQVLLAQDVHVLVHHLYTSTIAQEALMAHCCNQYAETWQQPCTAAGHSPVDQGASCMRTKTADS
jgi:hypothetical protein